MELGLEGLDKISVLTKRDHERKLDLQKRKDVKDLLGADNEKLEFFKNVFVSKCKTIEDSLDKSGEVSKSELAEHFNVISKDILTLQKYVAASNIFLRTYDIKKCQETLQGLLNRAHELEDELLPKKKFGFKNKSKQKHLVPSTKDEVDCQPSKPSVVDSFVAKTFCGFSKRNDATLILSGDDILKKDVTAEYLQNCDVKFLGSPSTLHLNHLRECRIFTGPVSTSIFADNCENCTLVIACQQLRLHSSKNVKIYLHVTSRAIMEDCTDIVLAPYNWTYEGLDEDFKNSGLDIATNNWKSVDDFNWLNVGKQSPNWTILDEQLRVEAWN